MLRNMITCALLGYLITIRYPLQTSAHDRFTIIKEAIGFFRPFVLRRLLLEFFLSLQAIVDILVCVESGE